VREAVEARGASLLYLPPDSPDLNPIEMVWSQMTSSA
jgi:transposase